MEQHIKKKNATAFKFSGQLLPHTCPNITVYKGHSALTTEPSEAT